MDMTTRIRLTCYGMDGEGATVREAGADAGRKIRAAPRRNEQGAGDRCGRTIAKLVDEVEALCRVYDGKDAESEQWYQTCERLERLDKLVKRIRIQEGAAQPLPSCRRAPAGSTM